MAVPFNLRRPSRPDTQDTLTPALLYGGHKRVQDTETVTAENLAEYLAQAGFIFPRLPPPVALSFNTHPHSHRQIETLADYLAGLSDGMKLS